MPTKSALAGIRSHAALDSMSDAAVLLDRAGRVTHANSAAHRLFRVWDGLVLSDGLLGARRRREAALFRRLRGHAAVGVDGFCMLSRGPGQSPVQATLFALGDGDVLVRLVAPSWRSGPPELRLRREYGLTAAEAELGIRFAEGATLTEAAMAMGIGWRAATTLQARLLARTGAARPADLCDLVDTLTG